MKILVFFLLCFSPLCYSQDLPASVQQKLESAQEEQEDGGEEMIPDLEFFRQNRLDLNQADEADLSALGLLTGLQVQQFILYRKFLGKLVSLYELQAIPGWDIVTIRDVLPFVQVGPALSIKEDLKARLIGTQQLILRLRYQLEKSDGYKADSGNHYFGDRSHLQFRYRYQYKNILYAGWLGEKDPGEPIFMKGRNAGFDFNSAHVFIRKLGIFKSIALGDYLVNLGQGLLVWQGSSFGKSGEVIQVKRQGPVLQPYRATGETGFCRGLAATIGKGSWETSFFISYRKLSGNVSDSLQRFSSLSTSGLHRTAGEIGDRKKIGLFLTGFQSSFEKRGLTLRIQAVHHRFNKDFQKQTEPYNLYSFRGRRLFQAGIEGSYTYNNIHLYGELAFDQFINPALSGGVLLSVDPRMDIAICYRFLSPQYQSLSAHGFSENTMPVNERGFYAGFSFRPVPGWQLQVFGDVFSFPWLRYRVHSPSFGYDYLVQLTHRPNRKTEIFFRFRHKNKPVNNGESPIAFPVDQVRSGLRFHVAGRVGLKMVFASRMEILWLNRFRGKEQGILAFVEGKYDGRLSANLRLQYFETGSYDSRIYAYESDVLYASAIPAFSERGFRYYSNLNYSFTGKLRVWFRWAQTLFGDKKPRGSGLDSYFGNTRSEIKLQLVYGF
jgi:hypothetical protein